MADWTVKLLEQYLQADRQISFELDQLDSDEAEEFYFAYGVSVEAHRGKRLSTPGLIAPARRSNYTAGFARRSSQRPFRVRRP